MKHREDNFLNHRNEDVFYQCFLPEGEIKAILLIVHGLAEHSGRYMNVVDHFVSKGYGVYAYDHPGHGRSFGLRCFVRRFDDYLKPLEYFSSLVRRRHPGIPVFVVGHSMGGAVTAAYLTTSQDEFSGAVLSGPAVTISDKLSKFMQIMAAVQSALLPRSGLWQLEAEGVSRDPEVVAAYEKDPLVYRGKITARLAGELFKAIRRTYDQADKITLPMLIVQGGDDSLVPAAGAKEFYEKIGSTDKTLKIYDGLYHEVFNEPEHRDVLKDVSDWLAAHLFKENA
jgi:acylglycerol lipase